MKRKRRRRGKTGESNSVAGDVSHTYVASRRGNSTPARITGDIDVNLDDQFERYFGTGDLAAVAPAALAAGIERMRVDFGMEKDRDRRFALWALLYMLGASPDLDVAFKTEADRDAARNFMDLADREADQSAE